MLSFGQPLGDSMLHTLHFRENVSLFLHATTHIRNKIRKNLEKVNKDITLLSF